MNTVPHQTLAAFREHGRVSRTLDRGVAAAMAELEELADLGIDLNEVARQLEAEGVDAFEAYVSPRGTIGEAVHAIS